jgi:hypothetical protein
MYLARPGAPFSAPPRPVRGSSACVSYSTGGRWFKAANRLVTVFLGWCCRVRPEADLWDSPAHRKCSLAWPALLAVPPTYSWGGHCRDVVRALISAVGCPHTSVFVALSEGPALRGTAKARKPRAQMEDAKARRGMCTVHLNLNHICDCIAPTRSSPDI